MKIAILSFEYPPETGHGGIGTYTWYQARALTKLGHQVHVLSGANEPTILRGYEHDGVRVFRFRSNGYLMRGFQRLNRWHLYWTKNRLENALSMFRAFRELNHQHHYDIVEMPECGAEGMLINNLTHPMTVVKLHSPSRLIMPFYKVPRADIAFCSFLERLGMHSAKAFSACSKFLAEEANTKLGIRRHIEVIPNGIDLELFDSEEQIDIRKKFDLPRDQPILMFSGRMERRKGVHLCTEIVTSILERFEVTFVFAGQDLFGYMAETLMPFCRTKQFRGSLHYLGWLDPSTVRSCLRQADLFVLPSLWENCPYSCLEAMAAGCGIVSTDQGGMPELIRDGKNGLLAKNGDPASYIDGLTKMIEDRNLRERLGKAARKTIEQSFTDGHIARISADYYLQCLNGRIEAAPESSPETGKDKVHETVS